MCVAFHYKALAAIYSYFRIIFYSRLRQIAFPCKTHFSRIRLSLFSCEAPYTTIQSFPETDQSRYYRSQLSINMHLRSDDRAKGQIGLQHARAIQHQAHCELYHILTHRESRGSRLESQSRASWACKRQLRGRFMHAINSSLNKHDTQLLLLGGVRFA